MFNNSSFTVNVRDRKQRGCDLILPPETVTCCVIADVLYTLIY